MNTIFWLVFLFILARSIRRLMERAGSRGKYEGPAGGFPPDMGRPLPENEEKPQLKIPEYLTRQGEEQPDYDHPGEKKGWKTGQEEENRETVVLAGKTAEPCFSSDNSLGYTAGNAPCSVEEISREHPARKQYERSKHQDLFRDMLNPDQVLKGMAWSQILGPRGGLRPRRWLWK